MPQPIKKIILKSLAVFGALAIILFVHILWVTKPSDDFHADIQLGRLDFPTPLTDSQSASAITAIKEINGITIARLNTDKTSLIYSYPTGQMNSEDISLLFKQKVDFQSNPFYVSSEMSAKGCPVMNKKSLTYRISMVFHNAFR